MGGECSFDRSVVVVVAFLFFCFFGGGCFVFVCFVSFYSYSSDLVCLGPFHLSVVIMEGKGSNSKS